MRGCPYGTGLHSHNLSLPLIFSNALLNSLFLTHSHSLTLTLTLSLSLSHSLPPNATQWFLLGPEVGTSQIPKMVFARYAALEPQALALFDIKSYLGKYM